MSGQLGKHNLAALLKGAQSGFASTGSAINIPSLDGVLLAWGGTVPSDAATGYATGCIFINTSATDQTDALYCNIGSGSSANFNLVTVASD